MESGGSAEPTAAASPRGKCPETVTHGCPWGQAQQDAGWGGPCPSDPAAEPRAAKRLCTPASSCGRPRSLTRGSTAESAVLALTRRSLRRGAPVFSSAYLLSVHSFGESEK